MRKKLIAAIIAVLILLAAAVGVIVHLENQPAQQPDETNPDTSSVETAPSEKAAETEAPVETTEEPLKMTFPTENPDDVPPEDTFGEDDVVPPVTGEATTGETEDPDANETPEDKFE